MQSLRQALRGSAVPDTLARATEGAPRLRTRARTFSSRPPPGVSRRSKFRVPRHRLTARRSIFAALGFPTTSHAPPAFHAAFVRHASKKQGGSSSNGRDSNPKYLGIKKYGGEHVRAGNIIARQRGLKWWGGANVGVGKDHTLFALIEGRVHFTDAKNTHKPGKKVANVVPHEEWPEVLAAAQRRNAARRRSASSQPAAP